MIFNSKIDEIIFFGGNKHMLCAIEELDKEFPNIKYLVLTSNRQLESIIENNKKLLSYLEERNIEYFIPNKIDDYINAKDLKNTYGLSFGSPWIFKQDLIKNFEGKLLNFHNDIIPNFRGGATTSWRIMMGTKVGSCTCHEIDVGIDTGDIISQELFLYSNECRIPIDYEIFLEKKFNIFFRNLISNIVNKNEFIKQSQQTVFEEYWPRLNTNINAYIDWNMNAYELDRFICAFDEPYQGASSYLNDKRVFFKDCTLDFIKSNFHSFQFGLVYKKLDIGIFIAINSATLIVTKVLDEDGQNIINNINVGDRFFTSNELLESAKINRIIYNANGLKVNH